MVSVRTRAARVAAGLVVLSLVLVALSNAFAAGAGTDPAVIVPLTAQGGAVTQVRLAANGTSPSSTSSTSFKNVPGAKLIVVVPAGTKALLVARFQATTECTDTTNITGGYGCQARIMIGGLEANPSGSNAQVFDSSSSDGREAHSIDRFRGPLGPGTYQVVVQFAVPAATNFFRLDSWTLEVHRIKA